MSQHTPIPSGFTIREIAIAHGAAVILKRFLVLEDHESLQIGIEVARYCLRAGKRRHVLCHSLNLPGESRPGKIPHKAPTNI